ncbi:MAG: hypothetical protein JWR53_742, partial [Glaciihabitans sp.]|nr:hypothetical protein [Glaciihabitans sp.]
MNVAEAVETDGGVAATTTGLR